MFDLLMGFITFMRVEPRRSLVRLCVVAVRAVEPLLHVRERGIKLWVNQGVHRSDTTIDDGRVLGLR